MSAPSSPLKPPKKVRFTLPERTSPQPPMAPPSILRPPPTPPPLHDAHPSSQPPSALHRRSSLPAASYRPRDALRALETLHSMRAYLRQTCNLENSAHVRRILRPLSLNTLRALLLDAPPQLTREFAQFEALLPGTLRHPHEQLMREPTRSDWQRTVRRAYRLRERREAEFHLSHFVAHQLRMPLHHLLSIDAHQRYALELDAFRRRMRAFQQPRDAGALSPRASRNSAPNSPARSSQSRRESFTDPIGVRDSTAPVEMCEWTLPGTIAAETNNSHPRPSQPTAASQPTRVTERREKAPTVSQSQQSAYDSVPKMHSPYSNAMHNQYASGGAQSPYGFHLYAQQPSVYVYMPPPPPPPLPPNYAASYHHQYAYPMGVLAPSVHEMGIHSAAAPAALVSGSQTALYSNARHVHGVNAHVQRYHGIPPPPPSPPPPPPPPPPSQPPSMRGASAAPR